MRSSGYPASCSLANSSASNSRSKRDDRNPDRQWLRVRAVHHRVRVVPTVVLFRIPE